MDFKSHIKELRERLLKIVIIYILSTLLVFFKWQIIYDWMKRPLSEVFNKPMIFTSLTEPFITALKISLYGGFILSLPFILWHIWRFISPALYESEKKIAILFVFFTFLMFLLGALFAYYIVFPLGIKVLIEFGGVNFEAMLKMSEYVGFFIKFMLGFSLSFELPVFSYFLAKINLIDDIILIRGFRYAVVIIFIVAAILTPPDPMTQILMAIPLIILYGVSILVVKAVNPYKEDL